MVGITPTKVVKLGIVYYCCANITPKCPQNRSLTLKNLPILFVSKSSSKPRTYGRIRWNFMGGYPQHPKFHDVSHYGSLFW